MYSYQLDRFKTQRLFALFCLLVIVSIGAGLLSTHHPTYAQGSSKQPIAATEATIHRYESPKMDAVNLYWIETNQGIILVDTGRFLSQARYALAEIKASSNKQILGILITHPHTDHFGGLPVFVESAGKDVPIYASLVTQNDLKSDGQGFIRLRNDLHGNDFPDHNQIPLPNRIVKESEDIQVGGLTFRVLELPRNETLTTTLYYLPEHKALFAGDILTNKHSPFLLDSNTKNWVSQLQMLLKRYPDLTLYPGHGEPGLARSLITAQISYITTFRNLVANALKSDRQVTPEETTAIIAAMKKKYPDYQTSLLLPNLLERGVVAVAKEF
jgi:glyoxylase-like metal-dependent hydrolase (beta-lactamase superfamily II)